MSVTHNTALNRYEMKTDHGLAIAAYRQQGDSLVFTHTEVPPADEGKGYALKVVKEALDDTRRRGLRIVPACSFVVAYVRRHPEYRD
jgi:predicted GNAT family acetyltransferase